MRLRLRHRNETHGVCHGAAILIGHLHVAGGAGGEIVAAVKIPLAAVLLLVYVNSCAAGGVTDSKRDDG